MPAPPCLLHHACRAKEFQEAVERFTVALDYLPKDCALLANRAAAYIKLSKWKHAEQDCDEVLKQQSDHLKALMRRCLARLEQSRPLEALQVRAARCCCVLLCMQVEACSSCAACTATVGVQNCDTVAEHQFTCPWCQASKYGTPGCRLAPTCTCVLLPAAGC
jgi:tetratricopeptide (TPR) repeat protein